MTAIGFARLEALKLAGRDTPWESLDRFQQRRLEKPNDVEDFNSLHVVENLSAFFPLPPSIRVSQFVEDDATPERPACPSRGSGWSCHPDLTTLGASRVACAFLVNVLSHYPGAAAGRRRRSSQPALSAFPDNVVESARTSSFSRPAQRSLALRPAHSRRHLYVTGYTEGISHFVTSMTAPVASGWSVRGWDLHPPASAALARRTCEADIADCRRC